MISSRRIESSGPYSRAGWLTLLLTCLACAEGSGGVTRMANGVRYEGRFINPEAYSAYAVAVEHETRGEYEKAVTWYLEARSDDPESPEIWARIGAAQCFGAEPPRGPAAAAQAFENGIRLDPSYYGNYFERARCEERARLLDAGLADATAAVFRRPTDEPANLLVARLLQTRGRAAEARAWLEAFQSYREMSPAMGHALEAARAPNAAAPRPAEQGVARPSPARSVAFAELRKGQLEAAREHAQLELGADPSNSDAWIATLVACDALRDNVCFENTLESLKTPSVAASETALGFLNELLARRVGAQFSRQ